MISESEPWKRSAVDDRTILSSVKKTPLTGQVTNTIQEQDKSLSMIKMDAKPQKRKLGLKSKKKLVQFWDIIL